MTPKKKMICILAAIAVLLASIPILILCLPKETADPPVYHFYPVGDQNVLENEEYLSLDRSVCYCDDPNGYGVTTAITEGNRTSFDSKVLFVMDFLQTVVGGDSEAYRAFFSQECLEKGEIPTDFPEQMIYRTVIYPAASVTVEGKQTVTYRLEYRIHRNTGTFRSDMESDVTRPQYLVLSYDESGNYRIEKLFVK